MSETNNSGDKTSGASSPKATLHLKRPVEQGTVRQSFSHGRSKAVVVEKVKRRILGPGEAPPPREAPPVALHVGHLPEAGNQPAYDKAGCKRGPLWGDWVRHTRFQIGKGATSSAAP